MGVAKDAGVSFGMAMAIDTALVGAGDQPGCTGVTDCYGGDAPSGRRMEATTLTNKAAFKVQIFL